MDKDRIVVENLSVRFKLSYDKTWTIHEKLISFIKNKFSTSSQQQLHIALNKINLRIQDGDIIGVIGPNGSGKSTLLKTICGIYYPDEGYVDCNGRISTLLSLGTGFDNNLSGIDNVKLNGLIIGMTLEEIEERLPEIISFADIGDHIYKPMKYYSSGMISRLSFSIVLAMKPDILLIDEIFSVGDLDFKKKSERAMRQLMETASCQLIVSHSLSFIREHCNRVIYMNKGEILMDGEPDDVIEMYEKDVIK